MIDNTRTDLSSSQQAEVAAANADNTSSTAFVVKDERNAAEITTAVEASDLLAPVRFSTLPDYSFVESADAAYESVLTYAGSWICGWTANGYTIPKRDKIDMRIVNDTRMGIFSTTASKGGGNGLLQRHPLLSTVTTMACPMNGKKPTDLIQTIIETAASTI